MTNYIGNLDGGQTSVEGHNRRTRLTMYSQGVMESGHLAVTQTSTPSTSVTVATGDIFLFLNDYFLHGWASTTNTIAITANSSGNPRIDKIVAYADLSAFTATSSNNPGAFKIVLVQGTAAVSPTAPSDVTIQSAIGAGNPFMSLASIAVANGFTSIVTANITDEREVAQFKFPSHNAVVLAESGQLVGTNTSGTGTSILELTDNNTVKIGHDTAAISRAVITTTGSSGAYVATLTPAPVAYLANMTFRIKANHTSPGASTINVNGLGTKSLTKSGTTAIASGDIVSGAIYDLVYDGTQFQVSGIGGSSATVATQAEVATGTDNTKMVTPLAVSRWHMPPQGFLYNGKIVPSVSSNNLTVALKTLAGTDPSSSDPVYVRIGDTVRTITSALSMTLNAGQNWFNLGSAELATKEADIFMYLYWNSTNSNVGLNVGRIPYATLMSDFTASGTAEKGFNPSTTWLGTDICVNIGRFAATLSAGAGYTWSVPTFTADNLIQRPVYETRWLAFTPTFTGMASQPVVNQANYKIVGSFINIQYVPGTTATSNATTKTVTLPFSKRTTAETVVNFSYEDNSVYGATISNHASMTAGSAVLTLYKAFYGVAWTSSGSWRFFPPIFFYDI